MKSVIAYCSRLAAFGKRLACCGGAILVAGLLTGGAAFAQNASFSNDIAKQPRTPIRSRAIEPRKGLSPRISVSSIPRKSTQISSQPSLFPLNVSSFFEEAAVFGSGGQTVTSTAAADVNGDGNVDLIVANDCADVNCTSGSVGILLGNGDGTFQPAITYNAGGLFSESIAVADLNGDGKPDVVILNRCADNSCASPNFGVLLGNGDGTFQPAMAFSAGAFFPSFITIADVNGDQKPDVLVVNSASNTISLLLGNGDGSFQAAATYNSGGVNPTSVAVADVNGDGKPDLLIADECADSDCNNGGVSFLAGNGDGTFQAAITYSSGGLWAQFVAVADVNGDGILDLLVANCGQASCNTEEGTKRTSKAKLKPDAPGPGVGVLLGTGNGTFQPAAIYNSGQPADYVAVADLNQDGKLDLVVGNCLTQCGGTVSVLLGNGDGTFQTGLTYESGGTSALSVGVADANGDGIPDIVVGDRACFSNECGAGIVGLLLGRGDGSFQGALATPLGQVNWSAVADVNGDGKADLLTDQSVLLGKGDGTFQAPIPYGLTAQSTGVFGVADLNGDNKPDAIDVESTCFGCNVLIGVMKGNGDGTFEPAVTYDSGGSYALSLAVADLNGDGAPDLVVAENCKLVLFENIFYTCAADPDAPIGVLIGNGDGTFQPAVIYQAGGHNAISVAVADVNGDKKLDLLVADQCTDSSCTSGGVSVLLGNGNGTFQTPVAYPTGGTLADAIAVADVNGDGKPDLLVTNDSGSLAVLLGNGDGTFQAAQITPASVTQGQIVVHDFNGDGKLDVALGMAGTLLLGNGDGTFQSLDLGASGQAIAMGDFDGNGSEDLAVGGVAVLLNGKTQAITFSVAPPATAGYGAQFTVAATASSGLAVLFASAGACTNIGSIYTITDVGICSVIARQSGGNGYLVTSLTEHVSAVQASSNVAVSTSGSPSTYLQQVTFTATVTGQFGALKRQPARAPLPTGTVSWSSNTGCQPSPVTGNPATATCTTSNLPTGTDAITATYSGDVDHAAGSGSLAGGQIVNKASQVIACTGIPASAGYNTSFTASCSANSGLPVNFASDGNCTNSATSTYTITGASGKCSVIVNAPGNSDYLAAPEFIQTVSATKATPTASFTGAPPTATYQSSFSVSATINDGATTAITASTACSLAGTTVTMSSGTGICTLTAKWPATAFYTALTLTQKTTAAKAAPVLTWPAPAAIAYGTALSATQLDAAASYNNTAVAGAFVYSPAAGVILTAGTHTLSVTFKPTANSNYSAATGSVALLVNPQQTATTITKTVPALPIAGQPAKIFVSVTAAYKHPTGNVAVNSSGGQMCTAALNAGTGSCSMTFPTSGTYSLTGTYNGDSNNVSSTSSAFQVVAH